MHYRRHLPKKTPESRRCPASRLPPRRFCDHPERRVYKASWPREDVPTAERRRRHPANHDELPGAARTPQQGIVQAGTVDSLQNRGQLTAWAVGTASTRVHGHPAAPETDELWESNKSAASRAATIGTGCRGSPATRPIPRLERPAAARTGRRSAVAISSSPSPVSVATSETATWKVR